MTFDVAADAYDRFMGRFSVQLGPPLAELARVEAGQRVLDVGCGPGALTKELVARVGADAVSAVDPSEPFVAAARERFPGVDVRQAVAEELPFEDDSFDAALAQLVVHFMRDAVAGLREMARVTRAGGSVAATVWDLGGGRAPISPFWRAARTVRPGAADETERAGTQRGQLGELFRAAGLADVEETEVAATVEYETFEEWWEPFTKFGVGPAGDFAKSATEEELAAIRERARDELSEGPFALTGVAWAARGVV